MSIMFVSVADAKARLRIDSSAGDADLALIIQAASAAVMRYILPSDPDWLDSNGDPEGDTDGVALDVPDDIQTATLMLVGILFRDPDGKESADWEHGFLPRPVLSLLYPYRLPTLA